jgi:hypothetical protein
VCNQALFPARASAFTGLMLSFGGKARHWTGLPPHVSNHQLIDNKNGRASSTSRCPCAAYRPALWRRCFKLSARGTLWLANWCIQGACNDSILASDSRVLNLCVHAPTRSQLMSARQRRAYSQGRQAHNTQYRPGTLVALEVPMASVLCTRARSMQHASDSVLRAVRAGAT